MRRRLIKLCVFLALGAVVNVAVAWGCVLCFDPFADPFVPRRAERTKHGQIAAPELGSMVNGTTWTYWVTTSPGAVVVQGMPEQWSGLDGPHTDFPDQGSDVVPSWSRLNRPFTNDLAGTTVLIECADGWPMFGLHSESHMTICLGRSSGVVHWGIATKPEAGDPRFFRVLPFRPLWPGFAINTLFYAATLWLLFAAPFTYRRRRRIKQGLCPYCKYPIGASPVCTECGAPVKPKPVEAAS